MNLIFDIAQLIALLGVVVFYHFYLSGYLKQKAQNLATKEDIKKIAETVESVKAGYAEVLEEVKSKHQLRLAAIEREKNIKKEVYMEAVEAITKSQNVIANFSNLNISDESITSVLAADSGKIAKVQIVGGPETVRSVTTFMSALGAAILDLMLERGPLISQKNSIEIAQKFRDKSQAEIERYIALMKQLNLEGNRNPELWETIDKNIEFEKSQQDKFQKDIDDISKSLREQHIGYAKKCMEYSFKLSELLPNAVLAVRKELDFEISSSDYLDIHNEGTNRGKEVFGEFIKKVKKLEA